MRQRQTPDRPSTSRNVSSRSYSDIDQSGLWVNNETGDALRISEESLKASHSPIMDYVSNTNDTFTLVSDDPYCPIGKARSQAANLDLPVNF